MNVEAILSHLGVRLVSASMAVSLQKAVELMRAENVDVLLVTDDCATEGRAVFGLLTTETVVDAVAAHGIGAYAMPISRFSGGRLVVCDFRDELTAVISMMERQSVRHVLAMDREQAVGLMSIADILPFAEDIMPAGCGLSSLAPRDGGVYLPG